MRRTSELLVSLFIIVSIVTNSAISSDYLAFDDEEQFFPEDPFGSIDDQQPSSEPPNGAASLAFVFDITGSMYDDLVQVIEGAAKILATTLAMRDKPLYNYVLVPFHDPG
jgi:hypothetical protein